MNLEKYLSLDIDELEKSQGFPGAKVCLILFSKGLKNYCEHFGENQDVHLHNVIFAMDFVWDGFKKGEANTAKLFELESEVLSMFALVEYSVAKAFRNKSLSFEERFSNFSEQMPEMFSLYALLELAFSVLAFFRFSLEDRQPMAKGVVGFRNLCRLQGSKDAILAFCFLLHKTIDACKVTESVESLILPPISEQESLCVKYREMQAGWLKKYDHR